MLLRRAILFTFVAFSTLVSVPAQTREKWQRVYTGEESVIEINVPSLSLEPKHILRAEFRTILAKPENLVGAGGAQYKSRLETIEFKSNESRYRLCETTLLDSRGVKL